MPRKTHKRSRKSRRRTLKQYKPKRRRGGGDSQSILIPTSAFKGSDMVNSTDVMGGITKL